MESTTNTDMVASRLAHDLAGMWDAHDPAVFMSHKIGRRYLGFHYGDVTVRLTVDVVEKAEGNSHPVLQEGDGDIQQIGDPEFDIGLGQIDGGGA